MVAKLTRLTHKTVTQLHLVAENCIISSSHSRQPVQKLCDTLLYLMKCMSADINLLSCPLYGPLLIPLFLGFTFTG